MSNRYLQITPSQFNPLSLEEVMMVPMMKRQQHDTLNSKIESQIAELAKVKPTDRDFIEAQKEKQRLNDMMMSQAERLTKEGVNPNSQSDFLKFNRDFQESISPTGKIGMFNEAYIQKAKKEAEFLDNHVKLGYSPKEALAKLEKAKQDYMNTDIYDEQGRVTMFNTDKYMAPNYINHIEEARKFMNDTKMDSREWDNITSGIRIDENGQYVHTGGNSGLRADNHAKIEAVLGFMNSRMSPTGDIGQVLDWRGYDKQQALNEIQSMSGIYKQKAIKDGTTSQISNFNPNTGSENETQGGIVDTFDAPMDFDGTVGKAVSTINNYEKGLKEGKSFTPEEDAQYNNAKESYAAFEKVKDNPEMYNQNKDGIPIGEFYGKKLGVKNASLTFAKRKYEQSKTQFLAEYEKQYGKDSDIYKEAKSIIDNGGSKGYFDNTFKRSRLNTQELTKLKHNFESKVKKYNDIYYNYRNDVFANNNAYTPGYTFVRTDKMNNKLEGIERTLGSMLSTPGTTNHQGIFTAVSVGGKKHRNLNTDDKEAIGKVLNSGIDKMEFVQVLPNSSSGLPRIEFKVKGNKNMVSEDIKESFWENDPTIGGEEGEFNIEIDLNRFSNISDKNYVGTTNILTQLIPIIRESNPIVADQMQRAIYERGKGVGTKR